MSAWEDFAANQFPANDDAEEYIRTKGGMHIPLFDALFGEGIKTEGKKSLSSSSAPKPLVSMKMDELLQVIYAIPPPQTSTHPPMTSICLTRTRMIRLILRILCFIEEIYAMQSPFSHGPSH